MYNRVHLSVCPAPRPLQSMAPTGPECCGQFSSRSMMRPHSGRATSASLTPSLGDSHTPSLSRCRALMLATVLPWRGAGPSGRTGKDPTHFVHGGAPWGSFDSVRDVCRVVATDHPARWRFPPACQESRRFGQRVVPFLRGHAVNLPGQAAVSPGAADHSFAGTEYGPTWCAVNGRR